MEERVKKELYRILGLLDIQIEMIEAWLYGKEVLVPRKCGVTTAKQAKELLDFIEQELSKAREEGKKEAFTKDEWFMLKLAMNDIFNSGNTAYEEISKKIEGYLKGELSGEAEHIKAHKEYLATSKQDTPKEWEEDIRREYGHMYIRNEDDEFCLVSNEIDWLIDEIKQLLDKAREEGRREYFSMGMEYFSLIEDSNIYQKKGWKLSEEKAERLQILDKMFNLLKDNK